jgi:hypothetical protein
MAKQTINIGTAPNDGTGTPLRTAFDYCNLNFTELYTAVGPSGNNIVVPGTATITGDLTVDTSTLKVDSANNRVGIGTASPGYLLDAQAATAVAQILSTTGTNAAYLQISNTGGYFYLGRENSAGTTFAAPAYSAVLYAAGAYPLVTTVNGGERYRIASDGVATWSNVGGVAGTAMTLNSTGLGIGDSPFSGTRLTLKESATNPNVIALINRNATQTWKVAVDTAAVDDKILGFFSSTATGFVLSLTDTGNLLVNVPTTPPTLAANSQMVFNLTSNTNLRISVRGTDGTTRTANITLA